MVGHDTAGLGHDIAEDLACDTANPRARASGTREGLAIGGVCRDTINCIVARRRLGRWVVSRDKRDMAGGNATIRRRKRHDMAQGTAICAAARTGVWRHGARGTARYTAGRQGPLGVHLGHSTQF